MCQVAQVQVSFIVNYEQILALTSHELVMKFDTNYILMYLVIMCLIFTIGTRHLISHNLVNTKIYSMLPILKNILLLMQVVIALCLF